MLIVSGFNSPSVETSTRLARLYFFTFLAHSRPTNVIQHLGDTVIPVIVGGYKSGCTSLDHLSICYGCCVDDMMTI